MPRLIAVAVGVLLGDAFLHLLPDAQELAIASNSSVGLSVLIGILTFFFIETVLDKSCEGLDRIFRIRTSGAYGDNRALASGEHHQTHDRSAAYFGSTISDTDLGLEGASNLNELRCRSGMQAKLVDDGNFARRHVGS